MPKLLNTAKRNGGRIVAVGTTTTRALESNISTSEVFTPATNLANLTILPGYEFRAVDATDHKLSSSDELALNSDFNFRRPRTYNGRI